MTAWSPDCQMLRDARPEAMCGKPDAQKICAMRIPDPVNTLSHGAAIGDTSPKMQCLIGVVQPMAHALTVQFRRVEGTAASMGWAGVKAVVADRPKGRAGGLGLGLSGGELLALSIGAGFHNQLYFSAEELGLEITELELDVTATVGEDMMISSSVVAVRVEVASGSTDRDRLLEHAMRHSTISNSVERGFPVTIEQS